MSKRTTTKRTTTSWKDYCNVCAENSKVGSENTAVVLAFSSSYYCICREHYSIFKKTVKWARNRKTEVSKSEIEAKVRKLGNSIDALGKIVDAVRFYLDKGLSAEDKF